MKDRIKKIMDDHGLSASRFADKIGVPRSGLSHILSGRNKPSLDYVLKILNAFPDIDPYWLIKGKKSNAALKMMMDSEASADVSQVETAPAADLNKSLASVNRKMEVQADKMMSKVAPPALQEEDPAEYAGAAVADGRRVERIVYFFTDGTFKEYRPK